MNRMERSSDSVNPVFFTLILTYFKLPAAREREERS